MAKETQQAILDTLDSVIETARNYLDSSTMEMDELTASLVSTIGDHVFCALSMAVQASIEALEEEEIDHGDYPRGKEW